MVLARKRLLDRCDHFKVTKWNRFFAFDKEVDESKRDVGQQGAEMICEAIDMFGELIRNWEE